MAPGDVTPGRRVGSMEEIERPGDYYGPTTNYTGGVPALHFLKPNASDEDVPPRARSVGHVCFPPHSYVEHEDGTITVSPSISNLVRGDTDGSSDDGWHGFLEHGNWRQV